MNKYKMKVEFSRVYEVEAEDLRKARSEAQAKAIGDIESGQKSYKGADLGTLLFSAEEYEEPTDWHKEAQEDGESIADDIEKEIMSAVENYKKENPDEFKSEDIERVLDTIDVDNIFEKIHHSVDVHGRAIEYADGRFVYNDIESITEALECIDRLSDYEEIDAGLWEGSKIIEDQINVRATYTLSNAIYANAEKAIKEKIHNLIVKGSTK